MKNPFESFVARMFEPASGYGIEPSSHGDEIVAMLRHIDDKLQGAHEKLDHLNRRVDHMDAHVKALSDAVNGVVTALNSLSGNLASHLSNLNEGLNSEDSAAVDTATAGLTGVLSKINELNASLSQANVAVAAQAGGQATPAVAASVSGGTVAGAAVGDDGTKAASETATDPAADVKPKAQPGDNSGSGE